MTATLSQLELFKLSYRLGIPVLVLKQKLGSQDNFVERIQKVQEQANLSH